MLFLPLLFRLLLQIFRPDCTLHQLRKLRVGRFRTARTARKLKLTLGRASAYTAWLGRGPGPPANSAQDVLDGVHANTC